MKIYCPCDNSFNIDHSATLDLDKSPELIAKIENGSFLNFVCPKCGRTIRSEIKTRVEWSSRKTVLLFVPESDRIACLSSCAGFKQINLETNKEEKNSYVKTDETPVIGYAELAERVAVLNCNLNPQAIEVLKFLVLSSSKNNIPKKIKLFFHKLEYDTILFYIHGIKKAEVAVMPVPIRLYNSVVNDINADVKNELFQAVYLANYLSYQNISTEEN